MKKIFILGISLLLFFSIYSETSEEIIEAEIILNPKEQIIKALENRDLVHFMKIVRLAKLSKIDPNIFNNEEFKNKAKEELEKAEESIDAPWSIKESLLMLGGTGLSAILFLGSTSLLFVRTNNYRDRDNLAHITALGWMSSFIVFISTLAIASRKDTKENFKKLKKISKLINSLTKNSLEKS